MHCMRAIIMAGGKGTRFTPLKPLVEVCGYPLFYFAYRLARELAEEVYIAVAPSSPLLFLDLPKIVTSGRGYEWDVVEAVRVGGTPTLVLPADSLIPRHAVGALMSSCKSSICTLKFRGEYTGVSLWNSLDLGDYADVESAFPTVNVNTLQDYLTAKNKCREFLGDSWEEY